MLSKFSSKIPNFYFVILFFSFFVVFDVEIVFFYPWAAGFKSLGWFGFGEMLTFLGFVAVGLIYLFKSNVLDFEKETEEGYR